MTSTGDPFLDSFLGVTGTSAGGVLTNSGLTIPGASTAATPAPIETLPARGGCPASWPDWACAGINAIGGIGGFDKKIAQPAATALTGKDTGGTTTDAAKKLESDYGGLINTTVIEAGVVLLGVSLLALGVWSVVKD